MEVLDCHNQSERINTLLQGKTILKFNFPSEIEFTDGTVVEFDIGDNSWRQDITIYEAGETR